MTSLSLHGTRTAHLAPRTSHRAPHHHGANRSVAPASSPHSTSHYEGHSQNSGYFEGFEGEDEEGLAGGYASETSAQPAEYYYWEEPKAKFAPALETLRCRVGGGWVSLWFVVCVRVRALARECHRPYPSNQKYTPPRPTAPTQTLHIHHVLITPIIHTHHTPPPPPPPLTTTTTHHHDQYYALRIAEEPPNGEWHAGDASSLKPRSLFCEEVSEGRREYSQER